MTRIVVCSLNRHIATNLAIGVVLMPVVLKHLVYNKLVGGLLKTQIQAVVCVYAKILGFYKAQLRSPEYQLVRAVDS